MIGTDQPEPCEQLSAHSTPTHDPKEIAYWSRRSDILAVVLLVLTSAVVVLDSVNTHVWGGGNILGAVWLQAIVPYTQLELLVALTRADTTQSYAAYVLSLPLLQWLGALSMTIYLLHWVVIYYLCFAVRGTTLAWPGHFDCDTEYSNDDNLQTDCRNEVNRFNDARLIPMWGIPVVVATTLCLSAFLFYFFEVPLRKRLRGAEAHVYRKTDSGNLGENHNRLVSGVYAAVAGRSGSSDDSGDNAGTAGGRNTVLSDMESETVYSKAHK